MAKTDYKSIDEYHKAFEGGALKRMGVIRELVHEVAPEVIEVISYQIPAFKIGDKFHLIYYCAFPKHISISSPWSEAMLKKFEADLKEMKVSKSAIQFPHDKPLPLDLIKRILVFRKKEFEAKPKKMI
jgi:uncharacterized protein YdhG (YjbR/CyaY superfamily)